MALTILVNHKELVNLLPTWKLQPQGYRQLENRRLRSPSLIKEYRERFICSEVILPGGQRIQTFLTNTGTDRPVNPSLWTYGAAGARFRVGSSSGIESREWLRGIPRVIARLSISMRCQRRTPPPLPYKRPGGRGGAAGIALKSSAEDAVFPFTFRKKKIRRKCWVSLFVPSSARSVEGFIGKIW